MCNKIRTRILLGREEDSILTILHIPTATFIGPQLSSQRLTVLDFLMDMQPLVLKDNVHTYNSKSHELNSGYSLVIKTLLYRV